MSATRVRPGDCGTRSAGATTSSHKWLRILALAAVIVFAADAVMNFLSSNSLSWGLAGNWALGIVIASAFVAGLWYAWTHFARADWRTFAIAALLTQVVLWALIVGALALTPANGSEDDFNLIEAVFFATVGTIIWVPVFGLPVGTAVGLLVASVKRALRMREGLDVVSPA